MAIINGKTYYTKEMTPENSEYNSLLLQYVLDEMDMKRMQKLQKQKVKRLDEILKKEGDN